MSKIIQKFLANNAVSTAKIVNDAVTTAKIADDAVTTAKIANDAVTNAKVATGIDAAKIGSGAVSNTEFGYLDGVTGPIQTQLNDKVNTSLLGAANGVATLDSGGKIPVSQLPTSVMEYKGSWNASTNTPSLADGTGDAGDTYRVSVAGTQNLGSGSITFVVGDLVIYNGSVWEKSPNTFTAPPWGKQTFVLAAADITNGYIDLAHVALNNSIDFVVRGAPNLLEGASYDFTVNYTGGAGGKTRITWLNDLATGGASELVAGDVVQVTYQY